MGMARGSAAWLLPHELGLDLGEAFLRGVDLGGEPLG